MKTRGFRESSSSSSVPRSTRFGPHGCPYPCYLLLLLGLGLPNLSSSSSSRIGIVVVNALSIVSPINGLKVSYTDELPMVVRLTQSELPCTLSLAAICGSGSYRPIISNQATNSSPLSLSVPRSIMNLCVGADITLRVTIKQDGNNNTIVSGTTASVDDGTASAVWLSFSSVSLCFCIGMLVLYLRHPTFRQFPSNMIFWRTLADVGLALQFLILHSSKLNTLDQHRACTPGLAFFTQFCLSASLAWYMVVALNFYSSISNPFQRPAAKIGLYHVVVWSTSFVPAIMAGFTGEYRADLQLCWFRRMETINYLNWVGYFIWLAIFLFLSLCIIVYGHVKLKQKMLDKTLAKRMETLRGLRVYVIVFTVYWTVLSGLYVYVNNFNVVSPVIEKRPLLIFFAIWTSLAGLVDCTTWAYVQWSRENVHLEEFDDISDALRYEFIVCTTEGIQLAVKQHEQDIQKGLASAYSADMTAKQMEQLLCALSLHPQELDDDKDAVGVEVKRRSVAVRQLSSRYGFTCYAPALFTEARRLCGVTNELFVESMSGDASAMKQNFSEGRSGSFFYFSVDRRFMVKTLSKSETALLLRILPGYVGYLRANPNTLLCKFYGLYSIRMYGHRAYFVVMHNCLRAADPGLSPSEVYDLKGSTIARYTRTHTNGKRKPNPGVLKDNNLATRIVLRPDKARELSEQAKLDAAFLRERNIMDYSLLLGIHYCSSKHKHRNCINSPDFNPNIQQQLVNAKKVPGAKDRDLPSMLRSPRSERSKQGGGPGGGGGGGGHGGGGQGDRGTVTVANSMLPSSLDSKHSRANSAYSEGGGILTGGSTPKRSKLVGLKTKKGKSTRRNSDDDEGGVELQAVGRRATAPPPGGMRHGDVPPPPPPDLALQVDDDDHDRDRDHDHDHDHDQDHDREAFDPRDGYESDGGIGGGAGGGEREQDQLLDRVALEEQIRMGTQHFSAALVGPGVYYIGIIDILQEWNFEKKMELLVKFLFRGHCFDYRELSVADPDFYSNRFCVMIDELFHKHTPT